MDAPSFFESPLFIPYEATRVRLLEILYMHGISIVIAGGKVSPTRDEILQAFLENIAPLYPHVQYSWPAAWLKKAKKMPPVDVVKRTPEEQGHLGWQVPPTPPTPPPRCSDPIGEQRRQQTRKNRVVADRRNVFRKLRSKAMKAIILARPASDPLPPLDPRTHDCDGDKDPLLSAYTMRSESPPMEPVDLTLRETWF